MQSLALPRRDFLTAGALAPLLASCATDLAKFSDESVSDLASTLGVCAASHVTLHAGKPDMPVIMSGCSATRTLPFNPVFVSQFAFDPLGMQSSRLRLTDDIRDLVIKSTSMMGVSGLCNGLDHNGERVCRVHQQ